MSVVADLIDRENMLIENVDATIIAQKPKMAPYIEEMRTNIARALKVDKSQVNIKATTEEGLGFTGEGLGISSQSICLLETVNNYDYRENYKVENMSKCAGCSGCAMRDNNKE